MIEQSNHKQSSGPGYIEVIVISLIMAALVVVGYDRMFAQKIKVMDLKGYLRTQKALLMAGEINEDQWKVNLDTLEQVLSKEANHPNHVVLIKEVVLKNGDEINVR